MLNISLGKPHDTKCRLSIRLLPKCLSDELQLFERDSCVQEEAKRYLSSFFDLNDTYTCPLLGNPFLFMSYNIYYVK